jgi:tetratricopeptide (TPR) repeat protein
MSLAEARRRADAEDYEVRPLFERAIEEGSPPTALTAALELGEILEAEDETPAAEAVYKKAAGSHSWTAVALARTLRERGSMEIAEVLCRIGADLEGSDPLFAPDALQLHGELLADQGKDKEAEDAYQKAIETRDMTVVPGAAIKLGELFQKRGDRPLDAYLKALKGMSETDALSFTRLLAPRLVGDGDRETAIALQIAAARRGPWAALTIGDRLADEEAFEAAESAYEVASSFESTFEMEALLRWAALIARRDQAAAATLYGRVIAQGPPDAVAAAERGLSEAEAGQPAATTG